DDPLSPEHRLVADPARAEEEPAAQLEVLEDQGRRLPRAGRALPGPASAGRRRAAGARLVAGAAPFPGPHAEEEEELPVQARASAAQVEPAGGLLQLLAALALRRLPVEHDPD